MTEGASTSAAFECTDTRVKCVRMRAGERARGSESQSLLQHNRIINRIKAPNSVFAATIAQVFADKMAQPFIIGNGHVQYCCLPNSLSGSPTNTHNSLPIQMRASICPAANRPNSQTTALTLFLVLVCRTEAGTET